MKLKIMLIILGGCITILSLAQKQPLINLRYEENITPTYEEVISMYKKLDSHYQNAVLLEKGLTDSGKPLHLFIINNERVFDPQKIKAQGKAVLLINNGIHAGEPAGIDASLQFAADILQNKNKMASVLKNTVIIIIPAYNVGGMLNRSAWHRANQTSPVETGFRGNAANLDLNRDFTKCNSENAKTYTRLFHEWDPDVFVDTHTTNGSDHQYSITLIAPQPDVFPGVQGKFIRGKMLPELYAKMKKGQYELIPYVDWYFDDPRKGIQMTQESPRYSSGYARMFHSYGMITEALIYKPFPDRVKSTYQFIRVLSEFTAENAAMIIRTRMQGRAESVALDSYPIRYELDSSRYRLIEFKGYEYDKNQISRLSGLPRPGYDTSRKFTDTVRFYDVYKPVETIKVPEYYILPQAWTAVVERLKLNGVEFYRLKNDTVLEVEVDYITDFTSPQRPYNGHYYHEKVTTAPEIQMIKYHAGDLLIPVSQERIAYILEMLEPKAVDSFFRWNFFDSILDAREYFSTYGFEENALKYLEEHPDFKQEFLNKRMNDNEFANDHRTQLAWIYNNSEWAEKSHRRYPAGRIFNRINNLHLLVYSGK
jgi:hypothetical protein